MDLLKNRAVAVAVGATVIVTGANLTAYAAGGHILFGHQHHAAGASAAKKASGPKAYKFVIPKGQKVPFTFQAKNLPKGKYDVSLSIATAYTASTAPDTTSAPFCGVIDNHNHLAVFSFGVPGVIQGDVTGGVAINQGTGEMKVTKTGGAAVMCDNADQTFNSGSTNEVVFTALSKVKAGRLHPVSVPRGSVPHFGR